MPQGRFLATDIEGGAAAPPTMGRFSAADIEPDPDLEAARRHVALSMPPGVASRPSPSPVAAPPLEPRMGGPVADRIIDLIVSGAEGVYGAGQSMIGLGDIATGGRAGEFVRGLGIDLEAGRGVNRSFYSEPQQEANRKLEEASGFVDTARTALENPSTILQSVVQAAAPMAAGGLLSRAAGAVPWLAKAGPAVLGAAGEGVMQAGSAAEQTARETGGLTAGQTGLALASGAGTAALGVAGGKLAQKLGIADVESMLAGATTDTAQRGLARQVLYGAMQEGLLEELPQSVQEQVLQNLATGRPLGDGVDHAAVLGALSGAAMGGGAQVPGRLSRPSAPLPITPLTPPAGTPPAPVAVEPPPVPPPVDAAPVIPPTAAPAGAGRFTADDIEGLLPPRPPITLRVEDDTAPPPSVIDMLSTGEAQPRLPGDVGRVREQDVPTPAIDMPFSLTPETNERPAGEQQGMFGSHEIDTPQAGAQTTVDVTAGSDVGEAAGQAGRSALAGVEASVPPHSRESPKQAERRRIAHFDDTFGYALARAQEIDPAVDPADLRAEFDERIKFINELDDDFRASGGGHRDLLEAIAKAGGISLQSESNGGLIGELRRVREDDATGPFGTFGGVPNVFRAKRRDGVAGRQVTGHPLDVIVQSLQSDGRFGHIEDTNDLLEALDEIARLGDVGARGATYPGSKELQKRAGIKYDQPWWQDSWRTPAAAEESDTVEADDADISFNVDELEAPPAVDEPPGKPAYAVGDEVNFKGSKTGRAKVQEVFFAKDKKKGDRWRVRVAFPQKSASEVGPAGYEVVSNRDAHELTPAAAATPNPGGDGTLSMPIRRRQQGPDLFAEPKVDTLDTGEKQPRLPEAGAVREQNVATPEFELPFSLTSEASKAKKGKQNTLFGGRPGGNELPVSTGMTRELPPAPKGATAGPVTPRIRPADIIKQMQGLIDDIPVSTGHFAQRAYGIYKIKERAIRLKVANNLQTFFHESGHHIDENVLGIERTDPRWEQELIKLGQATSSPSYSKTQQLQEGAAEFLRTWFTEPHIAKSKAPAYTAEFERQLEQRPEWRDGLHQVRENLQNLISQNPATRGRLRINRDKPPRFPRLAAAVEDPREAIRAIASRAVDDLMPIRTAVEAMKKGRPIDMRLDAYALARISRGSAGKAEAFLEHGIRGRDGKFIAGSLSEIVKPVREHLDVLGDFLVARRAMELHGRGIEPGMPITEAKGIIAETEARDDIDALEKAADQVYAYQDALLEYARLYGSMSRQQIAAIKHLNQQYVPMQRVLDAAEGSVRGIAKRIANRELPIKRIKGSGRDVIDPFESIITNTFAIVDMVEKNRAMQALVRQAEDTEDSARWLEKIPTPRLPTRFKLDQVRSAIMHALDEAGVGQLDPKALKKAFDEATKDITDPEQIELAGKAAKAGIGAVNPVPSNLGDFLDEMVTVWTPAAFARGDEQIVTVLRNGVREFWQVHDDALYQALSVMGPRTTSTMMQLLGGPTRLLRTGATLTPGFVLRNPGRDTLTAYMQSRYGFIPVYDTVRGLIAQVRGDEDARLFYASGVAQASMAAQYRAQRQEAVEKIKSTGGLAGVVFHPIDMLRAFSEWTETATRLGEFKLALDAGGGERGIVGRLMAATQARPVLREEGITRATMAARDVTTDFARGGSIAKEINEGWAFFNARVQGYVRLVESIRRDPVGVGLKAAALAAFSAALWALNADDDDYQEKEPWEKATYWHLKIAGEGTTVAGKKVKWLRIPKPFDYGYAADITEAALDYASKGDPIRFREMKETLVGTNPKQLVVSLLPTAVLPMLEAAINYSSFRDTHIVRPWDMDLEPDLQYTEWTSETAKQLGKVIPIAPALLDHLIYGYTAGLGRGVVGGVDTGLGALGVVPRKNLPDRPVQQLPIVGNFLTDDAFGGGAQSIQDLYDVSEAITRIEASAKADIKRGDQASADRRLARSQSAVPWERRDAIDDARKALKELSPTIKAIYAAPPTELTPAQKRVQLDAVREEMVDISRRALGRPALRRRAQ